jgi:hypothetical protein
MSYNNDLNMISHLSTYTRIPIYCKWDGPDQVIPAQVGDR